MRRLVIVAGVLVVATSRVSAQQGFVAGGDADGPEVAVILRMSHHFSLEPGLFVAWGQGSFRTDSINQRNHSFEPGAALALRWLGSPSAVRPTISVHAGIGRHTATSSAQYDESSFSQIFKENQKLTAVQVGLSAGVQLRLAERASLSVEYGVRYWVGHGTESDSTIYTSLVGIPNSFRNSTVTSTSWYNYFLWTVRLYRRNHSPGD